MQKITYFQGRSEGSLEWDGMVCYAVSHGIASHGYD